MNIQYKPKFFLLQKIVIWFFAFIQDILHWKNGKLEVVKDSMIVVYDFFELGLDKYMSILIKQNMNENELELRNIRLLDNLISIFFEQISKNILDWTI